jgi:superfamily II DNA/RNA helicase
MPQHERVQFLSDTPETDAQNTAPLPSIQETVAPDTAPVETALAEPVAEPAAAPEVAEAAEEIAEPAAPQDESDADERVAEDAAAEADGFAPLGLSEPILRALHDKGYLRPTPIQAQAIPTVLMGRDVLGCAQTGTGKTAGFTLPLLDILSGSRARARMPRSLILEPTRELALQVAENFVAYGKYLKLNHALLIGGESMNDQKDALAKGVDVLIATPGRLIDLFERGGLLMRDVRVLVIDEADRMLDMGFIPDIERIVAMLPATRQTLFFSATMAPEIRRLADAFLSNPKEITVSKPASVAVTITSGLVLVNELDKREALRRLIRSEDVQNALIFCNRKRDVDILLKSLLKHGFSAGALHGDLAQSVRFATLEKFKAGELRLLVCSDVAARGIDIGGLSHVFNFDVPHHAEDYVHRIGRTGRAGKEGRAFTIATPDERQAVEAVEKLIAMPIPRIEIPGLDVVEWAESDGRRGRGRGRGAKPAAKSAPRAPKEAAAVVETPREAPAPRSRHRREEPAAPRAEEPRRRDRAEQPRAEPRTVYATDNNGPNVRGFGADIPAFMLIRKRGPLAEILEEPSEIEEDDISHDNHGGEEIAA